MLILITCFSILYYLCGLSTIAQNTNNPRETFLDLMQNRYELLVNEFKNHPIMYAIGFIFCFLYWFFAWDYAKGVTEYAQRNNKGINESSDCWQSVLDEYQELVDAFNQRNCSEMFMEFFDVVHGTIKYCLVTILPQKIYFHWLPWALIFPIVMPVGIKLAMRYKKYKCIRNHARSNENHKCINNCNINDKS